MAGPSYQWLSTGFPSLQELAGMPAPAQGPPATIALGAPPPAPPPMLTIPGAPVPPPAPAPAAELPPMGPPAPPAPPAEAGASHAFEDPKRMVSAAPPAMSQGPSTVSTGVEPAKPPPPMPADVQFRGVGGGVVPAHEAPTRGPKQNALLMGSFDAPMEMAGRVDFRNQIQAEREQVEYERQAAEAMKRQDAAQRVAAQRAMEMERMRVDYDESIAKLGQMHLDDNRWWARKSTGDKIGTIALVFLGGIASLGNGGQNLAYNATVKEIDDDLAAQKFDYFNGVERARGAQNAFAMAMEQYGQEDAAWNAARAAALDFAAAKTAGLSAEWKGTESANAADEFRAKLLMERDRTAAAGLQFVPAKGVAGGYKMYIRGQEIPGIVSEKQAQQYAVEHGVKPAETMDLEFTKGGIHAATEQAKIAAQQQAKKGEYAVKLPSGETVYAQNEKEMGELRDLSISVSKTKQLVAEAKQLRESMLFRGDPTARARLGQIQAELLTDFGVQHKLGALSDTDYKIAQDGTADLFGVGPAVEARLDRLTETANKKLSTRVATIPGASAKASGQMPGSTKYPGEK